jgi:hypothetical protein
MRWRNLMTMAAALLAASMTVHFVESNPATALWGAVARVGARSAAESCRGIAELIVCIALMIEAAAILRHAKKDDEGDRMRVVAYMFLGAAALGLCSLLLTTAPLLGAWHNGLTA